MTGRVYLLNAEQILKYSKENTSSFIAINKSCWLSTYFFILNKMDYFKYLEKSKRIMDDYDNRHIEEVWYDVILHTDMKVSKPKVYPRVSGINGGSSGEYDLNFLQWIVRELALLFTGYFDINYAKITNKIKQEG